VLRNLLSNALRYTPSGRVVLGVRRRGGGVELQVLDTGPGLAAAQVDTLLRPFEQGRTGAADGFGLGLFIVRSLCEQAGWTLRIRSRVGRGSCFAVWIPPGQCLS
jgi:signal transduction histidine kinase